jgi:hypothetical protein
MNSSDHRKFYLNEWIHKANLIFLQQIKWQITGLFFPAYYELIPVTKFFKEVNYSQQIMDQIGSSGRPISVVEENRTIRALDVFGEYLHVVVSEKKK